MTQYSCWAASLGDCQGGMSREHLISASQFESASITLSGLPWCREPKSIGLGRLVAKNLCRRHNSALSPVDQEAECFKRAIRDFVLPHVHPVRRDIDARRIERWLLKTAINLALQEGEPSLDVTDELVRIAFGLQTPSTGRGFFFIAHVGEQIRYPSDFRFESWNESAVGKMRLATFFFHGCRLIYAFDNAPQVNGATRIRRWKRDGCGDLIRVNWRPGLSKADLVMPPAAPTK